MDEHETELKNKVRFYSEHKEQLIRMKLLEENLTNLEQDIVTLAQRHRCDMGEKQRKDAIIQSIEKKFNECGDTGFNIDKILSNKRCIVNSGDVAVYTDIKNIQQYKPPQNEYLFLTVHLDFFNSGWYCYAGPKNIAYNTSTRKIVSYAF